MIKKEVIMETTSINKIQALIERFTKLGFTINETANEVLRFQAVDQILTSSKNVLEWGITADKLFELAQVETKEVFGEITYSAEVFQQIYGPSFAVDPIEFVSYTGTAEGIVDGKKWQPILDATLLQYAQEKTGKILFAYAEEYAGLIGNILQGFAKEQVVIYTATSGGYEVLHKLYPLADIRREWPDEEFDHIIAIGTGVLVPADKILIEMAAGVSKLSKYGAGRFFLPLEAVYNPYGLLGASLQYFYEETNLTQISEWLPLAVYEFSVGESKPTKVKLNFKEIITNKELENTEIKETPLIPLPASVISKMPGFNLVNYALSLGGIEVPPIETTTALFSESAYGSNHEMAKSIDTAMDLNDSYRLSLMGPKEHIRMIDYEQTNMQDWGYFQFMDLPSRQLWYIYFSTPQGKVMLKTLFGYCYSNEGYGQLVGGCRRYNLPDDVINKLLENFKASEDLYKQKMVSIEHEWQHQLGHLEEIIVPNSTFSLHHH